MILSLVRHLLCFKAPVIQKHSCWCNKSTRERTVFKIKQWGKRLACYFNGKNCKIASDQMFDKTLSLSTSCLRLKQKLKSWINISFLCNTTLYKCVLLFLDIFSLFLFKMNLLDYNIKVYLKLLNSLQMQFWHFRGHGKMWIHISCQYDIM